MIIVYDLTLENYLDRVPLWVSECHNNTCFLLYAAGMKRDLVEIMIEDKDRISEVMRECKVNSMLYGLGKKGGHNELDKIVSHVMNAKN